MVERMVKAAAVALSIVVFAEPAWSEERAPCRDEPASQSEPDAPDPAAEESAFDRDFAIYSVRRAFTEKLVREREARAFEEEQARYARFWALTKKLAEDAARATERDFERAVELYLAKTKLTDELAEGRTKAPAPAPNW